MDLDVDSALLGEPVRVVVAQPPVAVDRAAAPWVWLLHGRGDEVSDVTRIVDGLATAMAAGDLAPCTVAAPVGPWSETAWWVDSTYRDGGRPVESAVLDEVLPEVERRLGGPARREQRMVAGWSMGGGSAVGWLLRHHELFGAAALAAPAAFADAPPVRSSTDGSGAFGVGERQFDAERWASLMSYRRLLADRSPTSPQLRVGIVVGDAEVVEDYPTDTGRSSLTLEAAKLHVAFDTGRSSLTLEAAKLHVALVDAPGVRSSLRVVGAGHTSGFWVPGLSQAIGLVLEPAAAAAD